MKNSWKYIISFTCSLDGNIEYHCHSSVIDGNTIISERTFAHLMFTEKVFSKLLMLMSLHGIDFNEVNFNKVSMISDVEDTLDKNKIPHLKYIENAKSKWITYDE